VESESRRSSFLAAAFGTYSSTVGASVLQLVNVLVVSRALGPSGRGEVALPIAIATLTEYAVTLGLQEAMSNLAAREPACRRSLATNALLLSFLTGALGAGAVAALVAAVPAAGGHGSRTLLWVALASIPAQVLALVLARLAYAEYRFAFVNATVLLVPAVTLTVNGALWAAGLLSVGSAVVVWAVAQTVSGLALAVYVAVRLEGFGRPDLALAHRSLVFGLKTHLGSVFMLGNYRLDQWIVGAVAGPRQLGLYSIAVAWTEGLFFLAQAVGTVQRPDLVRVSRERAGVLAAGAFRAATLFTLPAAAVMVAAAPFLCAGVFGSRFAGAEIQLRVLVLGAFGVTALKMLGSALIAQGLPLLEAAACGAGFVVTIALDLSLVPPYGGLGAAVASTLSYTVCGLVAARFFVRALGVPVRALVPRGSDVRAIGAQAHALLGLRAGVAA
jgi:O-antigen/teichoic acid export membrane protein